MSRESVEEIGDVAGGAVDAGVAAGGTVKVARRSNGLSRLVISRQRHASQTSSIYLPMRSHIITKRASLILHTLQTIISCTKLA